MKKTVTLLMVIMMLLCCFGASAEQDTGIYAQKRQAASMIPFLPRPKSSP